MRHLWNGVLHAPTGPAVTQREIATAFARAAGRESARVATLPGWLVRTIGTAHPGTRELAEMLYQFEAPFVMESARSQAALGLAPTPLEEAAAGTVAWWQGRRGAVPV